MRINPKKSKFCTRVRCNGRSCARCMVRQPTPYQEDFISRMSELDCEVLNDLYSGLFDCRNLDEDDWRRLTIFTHFGLLRTEIRLTENERFIKWRVTQLGEATIERFDFEEEPQ